MNTIIIICNDPRIARVKEALQPILIGKIGIVQDFDTGLKEVFEKRPLVVFIQDEIAGVRGETVTRHIRSLLQANSPQFIQLDRTATGPGSARIFSNGIDLNLPDEELIALFREHLEEIPDIHWKDDTAKPAEFEPPHSAPEDVSDDVTFSFLTTYDDGDPVLPAAERGAGVPCPDDKIPAVPPAVPEGTPERLTPGSETGGPCLSPGGELPATPVAPLFSPPEPAASLRDNVPEPRSPEPVIAAVRPVAGGSGQPPFPKKSAGQARRWWALLIGGVVIALLCGVLFSLSPFLPATTKPQIVTAPPKHPIPAAVPQKHSPMRELFRKKLPSFIPQEGVDPTYGASRPGWERYVSPRHEYLVFRENGEIRALQIIALRQNAIDAPFVSSVLHELCGDASCVIKSRASRGGYRIEQGETSTRAEVIFYKKKGTGETRGVVISLP